MSCIHSAMSSSFSALSSRGERAVRITWNACGLSALFERLHPPQCSPLQCRHTQTQPCRYYLLSRNHKCLAKPVKKNYWLRWSCLPHGNEHQWGNVSLFSVQEEDATTDQINIKHVLKQTHDLPTRTICMVGQALAAVPKHKVTTLP